MWVGCFNADVCKLVCALCQCLYLDAIHCRLFRRNRHRQSIRRDLPADPLVVVKDSSDHIEAPLAGYSVADVSLEFQDEQKRPYREYMLERDHLHMLPAKDSDTLGPIILSVECGKKSTSAFQRGILRTKKGDLRFVMPAASSSKDRLKNLKTVVPDLGTVKLNEIKDAALNDALLKYEDQCCVLQYKFGVILWQDGQSEWTSCSPTTIRRGRSSCSSRCSATASS